MLYYSPFDAFLKIIVTEKKVLKVPYSGNQMKKRMLNFLYGTADVWCSGESV